MSDISSYSIEDAEEGNGKVVDVDELVIRRFGRYENYSYLVVEDDESWLWGSKKDAVIFKSRCEAEEIQELLAFNTFLEGV